MLTRYRRMGSMEQPFTMFEPHDVTFAAAAGILTIPGLSEIPKDRLQTLWNKIHKKYKCLQCQYLMVDSLDEYDWVYIGILPPDLLFLDAKTSDLHKLLNRECNHRFILLNHCGLTENNLDVTKDYDINKIPALYRLFIIGDSLLFNGHHGLFDGYTSNRMIRDYLYLLNDDIKGFDPKVVEYTTIEQCIKPQYKQSYITKKLSDWTPLKYSYLFGKYYANNWLMQKYNPLSFFMHKHDLLRFQFAYNENNGILSFPIRQNGDKTFNKKDMMMDCIMFKLQTEYALKLKAVCKLNKVPMSTLMQYICFAAIIDTYSDILTENKYKTVIGSAMSTIPLYSEEAKKKNNNNFAGAHICEMLGVCEYDKTVKIGSDKFWDNIRGLGEQSLGDINNKFPIPINSKRVANGIYKEGILTDTQSMVPPAVTNPGKLMFNMDDKWRYKVTEFYGASNPASGLGAAYLMASCSIVGINEICFCFAYGTQFFTKVRAEEIVRLYKQKMIQVAMLSSGKLISKL